MLNTVIGRNCEVRLAPGTFSNEWTRPVTMLLGQAIFWDGSSMLAMSASNLSVRSSGRLRRSHFDQPSGPIADLALFFLTAYFQSESVMGGRDMSGTLGTTLVKKSTSGSHLLLSTWKCLSHLLVHSSPNFWNSFCKEASYVSCLTRVPTSRLVRLSTLIWFCLISMILHEPLSWSNGCSRTKAVVSSKCKTVLLSSITATAASLRSAKVCTGLVAGFLISSKILFGLLILLWAAFWVSCCIRFCSNCRTWVSKISQMMIASALDGGSSGMTTGVPANCGTAVLHHFLKPNGNPGAFSIALQTLSCWIFCWSELFTSGILLRVSSLRSCLNHLECCNEIPMYDGNESPSLDLERGLEYSLISLVSVVFALPLCASVSPVPFVLKDVWCTLSSKVAAISAISASTFWRLCLLPVDCNAEGIFFQSITLGFLQSGMGSGLLHGLNFAKRTEWSGKRSSRVVTDSTYAASSGLIQMKSLIVLDLHVLQGSLPNSSKPSVWISFHPNFLQSSGWSNCPSNWLKSPMIYLNPFIPMTIRFVMIWSNWSACERTSVVSARKAGP